MPLDKVKIEKAPAAFADMARKHNALAKLIEMMKGEKGLKVVISEEKIVITRDPDVSLSANELHYADGAKTIDIDTNGIRFERLSDNSVLIVDTDGLTLVNGDGDQFIISWDNFTQNMEVRTIDVCDSGSPAYMDVIGSAPYT